WRFFARLSEPATAVSAAAAPAASVGEEAPASRRSRRFPAAPPRAKVRPAMGLTYRDAGVDIDQGDALVERIKPHARRTMRPEVLAGIGGFGGLFEVPRRYDEPVLVVGTDGVGTKLKLAFLAGKHDTVGIDLVA